jgi:translation initiation factor IF-3
MEITGSVKAIHETQEVTQTFKKRELVITTEEQYPQDILVEFTQEKTSVLDGYSVGENVKVNINLRGREWTSPQGETKYFNTIQGWRIEKLASESQAPSVPPAPHGSSEKDEDDLPF